MNTEEFHRKLTAILSADVQGYSRLMGEDEDSTVRTLTAYRTLMSSLIRDHRGHVVDTPGDNLLAKFDSGTDAVRCAVEIQEELRIRNADLPENRRMLFRIGINLGDVIEEDDRIYGDGINVAARIEGLAEGGGICISGFVYGAIKNKLSLSYEFMGEHSVKNIKDPVRVYRIRMKPDAETPIEKKKASKVRTWQRVVFPVVVIFILVAVAYVLLDNFYLDHRIVQTDTFKTIAVLPFEDLSPDKDQEYFVDGVSEEIINYLAQIPDLTVIARTSSFSFKGSTKKIQEIGSELGVAHILEGSVRKAGSALRITAQLIKTVDGSHIWSKTYDKEFKVEEMFSVQKDIATAVANELKVTFGVDESLKQLGGTDNKEAYELYLIALGGFQSIITGLGRQFQNETDFMDAFNRYIDSLNAAIELDPQFALAWALKASFVMNKQEALIAANRAIELEPNIPEGYVALGSLKTNMGKFNDAESAYRKAIELTAAPSSVFLYSEIPMHYIRVGKIGKAHKIIEELRRTDPLNEMIRRDYVMTLGLTGNIEDAMNISESSNKMHADRWTLLDDMSVFSPRLRPGTVLSNDDMPNSIKIILDEYGINLETLDESLRKLREIYNNTDENATRAAGFGFILIGQLAAYFGDPEFSMDVLEKLISNDNTAVFQVWYPAFHEVRQLPRFKELVRKIGLVDCWEQFGYPDLCHPTDDGDFVCD